MAESYPLIAHPSVLRVALPRALTALFRERSFHAKLCPCSTLRCPDAWKAEAPAGRRHDGFWQAKRKRRIATRCADASQ